MSLNCINSALFKSHFCFHSIVTIVIICVLWDDKNRTNSKYVLLQFYHFTCIKKNLQNRLHLNYWHGQESFKLLSNFHLNFQGQEIFVYRSWKMLLLLIISLLYVYNVTSPNLKHNEKRNLTVTMIYNHIFQNKY